MQNISGKIFSFLSNGEAEVKELLPQLKGISKEKAWKVINHLVAEEKLVMDKLGKIKIK